VNPQADKPGPRFVTCRCQHCNGGIEFDMHQLSEENSIVACPHCGQETELHTAVVPEETPISSSKDLTTPHAHKRVGFTKGSRIVLSRTECASPLGRELVGLLGEIAKDRIVTEAGVWRLNAWLNANADSEIPAIRFLLNLSDRIFQTGGLTSAQTIEIHLAIERAVPKSIRGDFTARRQEATIRDYEERTKYDRRHSSPPVPATEKQLQYIHDLGGNAPRGLTKGDASDLIDELKGDGTFPTPRQVMVLRFWNRMDMATRSKAEITEWLNRFYAEDSLRKGAWTLYKIRHNDDGTQRDPSWVEIGVGENYRREIVSNRKKVALIGLGIIAFAYLLWKIVKAM